MPRIRSTHPGQWTDEAFVSCSPLARLLALGVRNEADDGGVFEWKPLQIKMRLLPADNCDVGALLAELEAADLVRRYEIGGRLFGAVRNFCRYQCPKKPRFFHPRSEWVDDYTARSSVPDVDGGGGSTVPIPQPSGTGPENAVEMEGIGGNRGREGGVGEGTPALPAGSGKRVRRLDDLVPDDELRDVARREGRDVGRELERFRGWCVAKGKTYRDYRAAFRNWLTTGYGRPPPDARPNGADYRLDPARAHVPG